jgi:hypothetical protein
MQNFPVPKNSIMEWTEWFKGFDGEVSVLRGKDYQGALDHIDSWMKSDTGFTQEEVKKWDQFFEKYATVAPSEVLVRGQPWGALEEMRLGHQLVKGLTFTLPKKGEEGFAEAQPWVELLTEGTFSAETLSLTPVSYQTTDGWFEVIKASADKVGLTWLHALHLGVNYAERGATETAIKYFTKSMEMKPNAIASRCLGVLQQTPEEAYPFLQQAWNLRYEWSNQEDPALSRLTRNLVTELSFFLIQENWMDEMKGFYAMVRRAA